MKSDHHSNPFKMRPMAALRAVREVVRDPEQTADVFRVIQALGGPSLGRNFASFQKSAVGKRVLAEQLNLVERLNDATYLQSLPDGSLGKAYHTFITREHISAGGLEQASEDAGYYVENPNLDRFVKRTRASHDLFHVLTRIGRDPLGEACLLAFTYGQTGNIAFAFILTYASFDMWLRAGSAVFPTLWRSYRDGKRAGRLLNADWESMLEQPLEKVRRDYAIVEPVRYQRLSASLAMAS